MSASSKFSFTISDLARFLGKSSVTLRGWERNGLIRYPRNGRNDRRFALDDLRAIARHPTVLERVSQDRIRIFEATITLLEIVENEDRNPRSARSRED
jgi:hypothetical protein